LLDETSHEGFRFVHATCPVCDTEQNLAVPVGVLARCIMCEAPLPNAAGIA